MPKSFDEYADEKGVARSGTAEAFFAEHPELVDEIRLAREYPSASWQTVLEWLQDEWGFALKDSKTVSTYMSRLS